MSDTMNRILVAAGLAFVIGVAAWLEFLGIHGVYWLCIIVGLAMIGEFAYCLWHAPRAVMFSLKNLVLFGLFLALLGIDFASLSTLGHRPMLLLFVLCVICVADICAWLFGRIIGGDKLWERISEHKRTFGNYLDRFLEVRETGKGNIESQSALRKFVMLESEYKGIDIDVNIANTKLNDR